MRNFNISKEKRSLKKLKRVLVSNRGEIAIRIAKAATSLGMESVSVYPRIDAQALHPTYTTHSAEIPGEAIDAYLNVDTMMEVAQSLDCDCIHPGYGFLSENAELAARCEAAGISFVGPSSDTLRLFGDKVRARTLAQSLGIPVLPGSESALKTADLAANLAGVMGYPIMLKASAGGGGRGMRLVQQAEELQDAFERCCSEAEAAFGNGAVFMEKYIERPRHIEVQILADQQGKVMHLYERDCSVQLRNQKVVEIAPAAQLDATLRENLYADAIKIAKAAQYSNAGTVEFLVSPESGNHYFIECNPRIQVEHTVTEMLTGVDLMEAQFQLAAGDSLSSLGLDSRDILSPPKGFAVQVRVVAQGAGKITTYKEPSGPGIRVDACGYAGWTPPPQFDPLFGKVIGTSNSTNTLSSALDRTLAAINDYHIEGLPNNLVQLRSILGNPSLREGDARTTLLLEKPELLHHKWGGAPSKALTLLTREARTLVAGAKGLGKYTDTPHDTPGLLVETGKRGAEAPMTGVVVEVLKQVGDFVNIGESILVISAMKMETEVTAPCTGTLFESTPLFAGDTVNAGQVVAVITPDETSGDKQEMDDEHSWAPVIKETQSLRKLAETRLAPGSTDRGVVRQRNRGKLTCRERIDLLLDKGSFREVGSLAGFASYDEEGFIEAFTPANHFGGWGKIEGRPVIACADDFTSRGGHSDGAIGEKSRYLDKLSLELKCPSLRLLDGSSGGGSVATMVPQQKKGGESRAKESTGAIESGRPRVAGGGGSFLPGDQGSNLYAKQLYTVPVVNLLLGSVVGLGAAKAVLGHFSVMVRHISQLFVAGPPVVQHAMGYDITKEDLGAWHIHCTNGSVDNLADSEEEAFDMTKRFLSYLPSSAYEAPPHIPCSDPSDRRAEELFTIIPRKRTTTFDIRKAIKLMADQDSFFEMGSLWGTDQVTGFVRFKGYPVGVIASDSRHANGGALTADGCDKVRRHLDLCDLFHIPILNLVDNPGFAVGLEHEIKGTVRKGGEWMIAFAQVTVPIFTVLMRRSFGVAGNNFATPLERPSVRFVWPAADTGGIPPEGGIEAAYKRQLAEADDPEAFRAELYARIESSRGPIGPLNRFEIEEMIDPRDTRCYVCDWVENAYRVVSQPGNLMPRALQFRP